MFIARKILGCLAAPYSIDQKHLFINASIGVSAYPGDGKDAETLIHKADTAMYDAKKLGRNNYQFFRANMQARVLEWQSLRRQPAQRPGPQRIHPALSAEGRISRPRKLAASKPCCAGITRNAGSFRRFNSCPLPRSPG